MKRHLVRFGVVVAVAAAAVMSEQRATAQYAPYRPMPQAPAYYGYPTGAQPGAAVGQPGQPGSQPYAAAAGRPAPSQPAYTANRPQQSVQGQLPLRPQQNFYGAGQPVAGQFAYQPQQQNGTPTYSTQAAPTQAYPSYPFVAYQPNQVMPTDNEVLPGPGNAENGAANGTNGSANGATMPGMATDGSTYGYPQDCNTCGTYPNTGYYGASGYPDYGLSSYFNEPCYDNQWFGGVYFLYMERDNPGYTRLSVQVDQDAVPDPYYPPASTTIISSADVDFDYREGIEFRFGSTFTCGDDCDACGYGYGGYGTSCGSCAPEMYAWEVAFWGIDRDIDWFTISDAVPTDNFRMYGMVNHAGLEYNPGTGYNPVNTYYDYQMPIVDDRPPVDGDVRVLAQRVRTNFRAYNLELNLFHFPICGVPCSTGSCGYDQCGYGNGCEPAACGSAFSMSALCGVRYFRADDDFELATEFGTYAGGTIPEVWNGFDYASDNELFHDIQVENHLVGFQLGGSMNYCIACKWNVFVDSNFGLYNNHINQYQRVYNPNGNPVRFVEEVRPASARSDKNDLAFLGELRLGGSYDISCNWRAVLAYRAVAISGVALSTEQLRPEYSNWSDMARIDSNSSIIIHGVQIGAECRY